MCLSIRDRRAGDLGVGVGQESPLFTKGGGAGASAAPQSTLCSDGTLWRHSGPSMAPTLCSPLFLPSRETQEGQPKRREWGPFSVD